MTCPNCGANNIDGSSFCIKCETNLKDAQVNINANNAQIQSEQPMNNQKEQLVQQPDSSKQPQNNYQQPMNNTYNNYNGSSNGSKPKSKIGLIIIIIILVIVALGVGAFLYFKKNKVQSNDFDINYSTSFFIEDSNEKYALFNEDGKKLTNFIFTSTSDFVNGTALVKKDDAYGIINANGKMTVDFGKYNYITEAAGMYKVHGEGHYYLINGEGKVLYDLKDMVLDTFIGADTYSILEDKKNKVYRVLNYEGKAMVSFPIDSNVEDEPLPIEEDGYISVFYNNKNYILNPMTGKEIVSFDSNMQYCVNNVEEDGKIITMNSCVPLFQSQDKKYYKFIKDGKLYDLTDKCEEVYYSEENLVCENDSKTYLLDSNLNVGIDTTGKAYIDNNTYAMAKSGSFNVVDFYDNGSVVKNVECRILKVTGYMKNGLIILGTYHSRSCGTESGTYEYYKSNGEKVFGKSFKRAEEFDENGLAKVSEDKENYYLIDTKGKKISQDYSAISLNSDYYVVTKNDLKGIIDKKGNVILDCNYKNIEITEINNKKYAKLTTSDSKYIVYNIEKKSEVMTLDSSPLLSTNYIIVSTDENDQYYTYNGKMFYESK